MVQPYGYKCILSLILFAVCNTLMLHKFRMCSAGLEGTTGILRTWQTEMADLIAAQAFSQFGSFPGSSKFYSASLFQKASEQ